MSDTGIPRRVMYNLISLCASSFSLFSVAMGLTSVYPRQLGVLRTRTCKLNRIGECHEVHARYVFTFVSCLRLCTCFNVQWGVSEGGADLSLGLRLF
jgi:hypothetical protein